MKYISFLKCEPLHSHFVSKWSFLLIFIFNKKIIISKINKKLIIINNKRCIWRFFDVNFCWNRWTCWSLRKNIFLCISNGFHANYSQLFHCHYFYLINWNFLKIILLKEKKNWKKNFIKWTLFNAKI